MYGLYDGCTYVVRGLRYVRKGAFLGAFAGKKCIFFRTGFRFGIWYSLTAAEMALRVNYLLYRSESMKTRGRTIRRRTMFLYILFLHCVHVTIMTDYEGVRGRTDGALHRIHHCHNGLQVVLPQWTRRDMVKIEI